VSKSSFAGGTYTLRRLFPALKDSDLQVLQDVASILKVKKGQNLFIAGDAPRSIYGVANGCLKIVRETTDGDSVITRLVHGGQIVGIREVFGEFRYGRTAVALKESEVFAIDKDTTLKLIEDNVSISMQFMKIFCNELTRLEKRIESDLYKPAKYRVAKVLLELYDAFSHEAMDYFNPPLSRKDIAELADVTPETVSRALGDFRQARILETQGSGFHILDLDALQQEISDD
jgi:CRP/FNR family transcriptional regulator